MPPNVGERVIDGVKCCFREIRNSGTREVVGALSWSSGSESPAEGDVTMQEQLLKGVGRAVEAKGREGIEDLLGTMNFGNRNIEEDGRRQ